MTLVYPASFGEQAITRVGCHPVSLKQLQQHSGIAGHMLQWANVLRGGGVITYGLKSLDSLYGINNASVTLLVNSLILL